MDHEDVLGSEHWQRSLEKAGICRPGITLVLGDDDDRTLDVVTAVCRRVGTPLLRVSNGDVVELKRAFLRERQLRRGGPQTRDMFEGSSHQLRNAATALKTIRMLIDGAQLDRVVSRLARTEYVGRFSQVQEGVYADVAHNPSKMDALAEEIRSRFPRQMKKVFVVGISGNRNVVEVLRPITQQARVILVTAAGYKGRDPDEVCTVLRRAFPKLRVQSVSEPRATLKIANELRRPGEPVIYTGSTYMIDQALNPDDRLRHVNGTYGWREKSGKEWEEGELVVPDGFPPGKQPKRR
jgi:folylpolyglutamate synthase/dihydropteroate synthase